MLHPNLSSNKAIDAKMSYHIFIGAELKAKARRPIKENLGIEGSEKCSDSHRQAEGDERGKSILNFLNSKLKCFFYFFCNIIDNFVVVRQI